MKEFKTLLIVLLFVGSSGAKAQGASDTFNVEATLVTPISISIDSDLNFGTLAVSSTTAGTAVISTTGVLTSTGGVSIPSTNTATSAVFTVQGEEDYTYSISLPAPFTITETVDGTATMQVTLSEDATEVLTGGTQQVTLGAVLDVAAGQQAGVYAGTFDVSVDYN